MEEIYKPETEDAGKVEVYSRENNEMLGDMPQWLIHTGSYIVYGLIVFLVAGTALFKYPDTIKKAVTIDDMGSVEWITANQGGMIERFFIENQSQVKRNDTLGILKNTASLEDVQTFCNVLTNIEWYYRTNDINYLQDYPFNLIMGEMAPAYEQFTQAVRTCVMYQEFDLYPQKKKFLDDGIQGLRDTPSCEVEAVSEYLVTEPYGGVEQDEFLNGVLKLRTLLTPEELLDRLHKLEAAANRERIIHWGPRTLDLDILFYDNEIIDTPDLHIPHIDMENRDFVLKPMDEIAPYYRHPVLNKTIHQLLNELLAKDNQ